MIVIPKIGANVLLNCQATGQSLNFIYGPTIMLHTGPGDELGFDGCYILTISSGPEPMAQLGPFTDYGMQETEDEILVIALIIDPDTLEKEGEDDMVSCDIGFQDDDADEEGWL